MYSNIGVKSLNCERFRRISVQSLLNRDDSTVSLVATPVNVGDHFKSAVTKAGTAILMTCPYRKKDKVPITKTCSQCNEKKSSSQWREGPTGRSCLCNACGLFYRKLFLAFGKQSARRYLEETRNTGAKRRIPRTLYGAQRS